MRKGIYEVKERVIRDKVLVGEDMFCDICGKQIKSGNGYWHVQTHHNDWGNDSVESFEYFDVCSVECLKQKFDEYCDESNGKYNSKSIEVEHCTW